MHPRLFSLPEFDAFGRHIALPPVHTYGVLLAIAFLAGLWIAARQAKRDGLNPERITDLGVYVLIAGLIGAKLMLVAVDWPVYAANPRELLSLFKSGGVFYGGLIGAIPVAWWCAKRWGLDGWRTADVLAPGVAIGQAIGRLGCLAAGCCHGSPTTVPWAVTYTDLWAAREVGTPMDTPVHPTQVYESIATLLIFFFLVWLAPRKRFTGQIALLYVTLYAVARFGIEFYRGDVVRGFFFNGLLSTSQVVAIAMLIAVAAAWPYQARKHALQASPQGR